jgi:hypothetical protein
MTPEESKNLALALEGVEAVKQWPEHVMAWWRTVGHASVAGEEGAAEIAKRVQQLPLASPHAQWFRHSALHHLLGGAEHLVRQAELAPELPDPERWMALITLVWSHGVAHTQDRASFRQLLLDTRTIELLRRLGEGLGGAAAAPQPQPKLRRVAIFAQHLSTGSHAGTAMTFNLRAALVSAGVETRIFASQELTLPAMSGFSAAGSSASVWPADPASWRLRTADDASVTFSDPRFSVSGRWKSIAQSIDAYAPDIVLFVGFTSPLLWSLRLRYPVLGMSLHTLPPLAPVDVWLAADPQSGAHWLWPGLPEPALADFPFRFWPTQAGAAASRGAIDVPPKALLMVTTGNRLESEISPAWGGEMVRFLDDHPQAHWLLVGPPQPQHERFLRLHPRIRVLPSQADLAAWIALGDVYVNPPRLGGGASIAIAMDLAVPVVSMAGSDGGDKIGSLAVDSREAFRRRLSDWASDGALRKQAGEHLEARFHEQLDLSGPEAARQLVRACLQAQQCFERRHSAVRPSPVEVS